MVDNWNLQRFPLNLSYSAYSNFTEAIDNDTDWNGLLTSDLRLPSYVIVSLVLSGSSLLLNILSMLAILNAPGRPSVQLRLAGSLTMADAVVAFSVFLHSIVRSCALGSISEPSDSNREVSSCTLVLSFALNVSGHLMCLFNLVAMSFDHYIAIFQPLRYASIVTKRRANYLICVMWLLALFGGFSVFLSAVQEYAKVSHVMNYCEAAVNNDYHSEYLVFGVATVSLFVLSYTYISVFCEVERIKRRSGYSDRDQKNRKTLWTTLLILGTFILLWVPSCLFNVTMVIWVIRDPDAVLNHVLSLLQAGQYLYCLMLCNCLADPIIYAIRVRDVQLGYMMMYWKISFAFQKRCRPKGTDSELVSGSMARNRRSQQFMYPLLLNHRPQRSPSVQTNEEDNSCV